MMHMTRRVAIAVAFLVSSGVSAWAQDLEKVVVAIGQGGKFDASITELGVKKGLFKEHGLDVDILYTEGGGETQQIVISGSADLGIAVGTQGVMGAFSKGAPIRIIGSAANGDDAYYYVKADSPIKAMSDAKGNTLAYSRNGSSTHTFALGFKNLLGADVELVATGGPPATLTAVMSNQVDIGWSAPPFGLEQIQKGQIRRIATSRDLPSVKDHTVRLIITNLQTLEKRPEMVKKFMDAYRASIEWLYSGDEGLQAYAEMAKIDLETARMVRDEFDTRDYVDPDVMLGVGDLMKEAIEFKYMDKALTKEQLDELIMIDGWQM